MPRQISEDQTHKSMKVPLFFGLVMDGATFVQSWSHSWMVVFAQIESLRGRMGESTRRVEGLFESLLAQSFDSGR
ncbi:MAG: hypothetical protein HY865_20490 [Chloroflexi bacterium]|nr:hypothetical protein [Chloroflexota bacterium]